MAAKPIEPSSTTRSPTPISVSSTVVSTWPSRSTTNCDRIRSTRTSAWLQPRATARSSAAVRTASSGRAAKEESGATPDILPAGRAQDDRK